MALPIIITNAGRAAITAASNDGTNAVRLASVGVSPTAQVVSAATTVLAGELKRVATITGDILDPDLIHVVLRDESADAYSLRSFAIYLEDGTMFAVYSSDSVILEKSTASVVLMPIDMRVIDADLTTISFGDTNFIDPAATSERAGVVELATAAEGATGTDAWRVITALVLKTVLDGRFGAGAPSAFFKTLLTSADAAALRVLLALKNAALKDMGHGNGLDADTLDGEHASTFLAAASYTAADVFAKVKTLHGSGSGLNADLLDGQDAGYFLAAAAYTAADVFAKVKTLHGAGSGLNADMLDGQDASYFLPASLFTALNIFNAVTTLDGAGSGLDADKLDGQHGNYFLPAASYSALDVLAKLLTVDGHTSGVDADLLDGQHGSYYLGAAAYTAADVLTKIKSVDGELSGLDADMVDGWHRDSIRDWNNLLNKPGSFPASAHTHGASDLAGAFASLIGANGYLPIPGGLILQWCAGASASGGEAATTVTFPLPFPNAALRAFVSTQIAFASVNQDTWYQTVGDPTQTSQVVQRQRGTGGSDGVTTTPIVWAIGY